MRTLFFWALILVALPAAAAAQTSVSVAVLPFANASGDAGQDALVDGLTEEIAAALAMVDGLNVGARSSAFRFKASPRDVRAIGDQLKKTHFVEGSVRKADDRVQPVGAPRARGRWRAALVRGLLHAVRGHLRCPGCDREIGRLCVAGEGGRSHGMLAARRTWRRMSSTSAPGR